MHFLERVVADAIREAGLVPNEAVVLGLSGGADSVALLYALRAVASSYPLTIYAAHLNHCLRGEESERDEAFVRDLCEELAVSLYVERATGLRVGMPNLEERARQERLAFLKRAAQRFGASKIALAHTRDDQAETVLMRFLRGAGVKGLSAMRLLGPGELFRPLLRAGRREVLDYLSAIGANWVEDSTNYSTDYLRNRIRHQLLPFLEQEVAKGLKLRLAELADELRDVDELIEKLSSQELEQRLLAGGELDIRGLEALPKALRSSLLRKFIASQTGSLRRVARDHIQMGLKICLDGRPSATINLPGGFLLRRQYDRLRIEKAQTPAEQSKPYKVRLAVPGVTEVREANALFEVSLSTRDTDSLGETKPSNLDEAWFDADAVGTNLFVRNFRPGDRISSVGLEGSKKVKKIFQEHRLPRLQRYNYPVVTLDNTILWVPGMARADAAMVTPGTKSILKVRFRSLIA